MKIFKEIHKYYTFYPQITFLRVGPMEFTISCPLTVQMLHTKGQDWTSGSSEEDVNGRHTSHDDGCQSIAIDHLIDSGNLIKTYC